MRTDRDPYEVLGVPSTASEAEIRRAFWALAKKYHPDVSRDDPEAGRRFIEVRDAAERLLDPGRRPLPRAPRSGPSASPPTTAPKPPPAPPFPPPGPPGAGTARPKGRPGPVRDRHLIILRFVVLAVLAAVALTIAFGKSPPPQQGGGGDAVPANGTVVWKALNYGLEDGWGINLAGNGMRIQIVPGTSTDIEVSSGYLSGNGHIAVLPPGQSLTYKNCVTATQKASSQAEPLSGIRPGPHGRLCMTGGGGDLAALQVIRNDGSNLVMKITVWEYV